MPKGPTLKRHVTTEDQLEGVDRAMQLHARAITQFSQLLLDHLELCNEVVILMMSLVQHDLHAFIDAVEAPTFKHELICINHVQHGLEDGKHRSFMTYLEGHTAVNWFARITPRKVY
jgi:hypothetical protein